MTHTELFQKLTGKWEGATQTWFEPDKLADESTTSGEFAGVMNGSFLRHTYDSAMKGKPRHGEEMIAFNSAAGVFQSSWIDDFHMNYGILFSEGPAAEHGFKVTGEYAVGDGQPNWSWRTEYHLVDNDNLIITAYNISPDGQEGKAVETRYKRSS